MLINLKVWYEWFQGNKNTTKQLIEYAFFKHFKKTPNFLIYYLY